MLEHFTMHISRLISTALITTMTAITASSCTQNEKDTSSPPVSCLRLPLPHDPATLDPRQARDLLTIDVVRLMFSGLTRLSSDGKTNMDLAESIEYQQDGLRYTVKLKEATWSDNTAITAHDFVYTWKSLLEKQRACPNAFQLFWIRNAKAAYDGKMGIDEVGIRAPDDRTLEIDLEMACPFFEQLLATPAFLAIQKNFDMGKERYAENTGFPTSGPYMLSAWKPQDTVRLIRNPYYTASNHPIPFSVVDFAIVDDATAVAMVEAHKLDWAGSPMGTLPIDSVPMLAAEHKLCVSPAAATSFIRVNVSHPLLCDQRLREAISLVIDRPAMVQHLLQGGQQPTYTLVPSCLLTSPIPQGAIDKQRAQDLVTAYCDEKGCTPESLTITLSFQAEDRSIKVSMAVQQDIKKALGINLVLNPCDSKQLFAKVSQLEYDLALGSWVADYFDPHTFYSVFERSSNGTNNTGWESFSYQSALEDSLKNRDAAVRQKYFSQLEEILAKELPVIPLYHSSFNYVKEATVDGITVSPLGHLDIVQP